MKYYSVLKTSILGVDMKHHNFTRSVGPFGSAKAKKITETFNAEQKPYMTYNENGTIATVTKWVRLNEKEIAYMKGE